MKIYEAKNDRTERSERHIQNRHFCSDSWKLQYRTHDNVLNSLVEDE